MNEKKFKPGDTVMVHDSIPNTMNLGSFAWMKKYCGTMQVVEGYTETIMGHSHVYLRNIYKDMTDASSYKPMWAEEWLTLCNDNIDNIIDEYEAIMCK